jgi:hypothetical protein
MIRNILVFALFFVNNLTAQEISIQHFQNTHPEVAFISKATFYAMSSEELEMIGSNYVLFEEDVQVEDIQLYLTTNNISYTAPKSTSNATVSAERAAANEVKVWLSLRQDVKILTQHQFASLSTEEQQYYINAKYLILAGNKITPEDIANYQY